MRRRHRKKQTMPYVRRMRRGDYNDSLRGQMIIKTYLGLMAEGRAKKRIYVLVQHGWKRRTMIIATSREEVLGQIVQIATGRKSYKQWQRHVARISRDSDLNKKRG